jgi:uncharacterized membrane protein YbhN (UPF0104 family)
LFIVVFVVVAVIAIYIFSKKIKNTMFLKHLKDAFGVLSTWNKAIVCKILLYSILRYLIFIVQFWLLLKIFNIHIYFFHVYTGLGVVYLVMTFLPIITFAEPAVRCGLSVVFFSIYTSNEAGIMMVALLLWICNVAVPALAGSVWLNFYKRKSEENFTSH